MNEKKSLITGIAASGDLHLGSYLGTIAQWQEYAMTYPCFFFIADLHALTTKQDPKSLHDKTLDMYAMYLVSGIDVEKHTVFVQSQVPEHAELGWILSCVASTGELNRMTQFKDKSSKGVVSSLGLYAYPCLMAADILLYQAEKVPVGEDQKQHLELTRNLAERFNRDYKPIFTIPDPVIPKVAARVMSLQDPTKKMSKSDENSQNSVFLLDTPDVITKKIKRAVTDSENHIAYDPTRPGISNLIQIYAALSKQSIEDIVKTFQGRGYGVFKQEVADLVVSRLEPMRNDYYKVREDSAYLEKMMRLGAEKASVVAKKTLTEAYDALGLVRV